MNLLDARQVLELIGCAWCCCDTQTRARRAQYGYSRALDKGMFCSARLYRHQRQIVPRDKDSMKLSCPGTKDFDIGVRLHCCRLVHIVAARSPVSTLSETIRSIEINLQIEMGENNNKTGIVFVAVLMTVILVLAVIGGCLHTVFKQRKSRKRRDVERDAGRGYAMQGKPQGGHQMPSPAQAGHRNQRRPGPGPRQPPPAQMRRPQGQTTNIVDLIPEVPPRGSSRGRAPQPIKAAVVSKPRAANPLQLPDKVMDLGPGISRQGWQKVPTMKDYSKAGQALPQTPPQMAKMKGIKVKTSPSTLASGPISPMNAKDWTYSRDSLVSPITSSRSRSRR